ncbi:MAG: metallophosphoesterase [Spirochaetales bacterium]|nr:metallophosphoesterase [Spirochaetales bacterium]
MKILCVADHVDPLVYSSSIKERFNDVDLVLGAGDLPISYYEYIISCLNKRLYFVFGNHNLKKYSHFKGRESFSDPTPAVDDGMTNNYGSVYIGGKVAYLKKHDLIIAGLGGSMKYNKGPNQYTEWGMYRMMFRLIPKLIWNKIVHGRYLDILLTHASPRSIHDKEDRCHRGFRSFLWFMKKFSPDYLIHGHIHIYDQTTIKKTRYLNTIVLNAYDHIVLDYERN